MNKLMIIVLVGIFACIGMLYWLSQTEIEANRSCAKAYEAFTANGTQDLCPSAELFCKDIQTFPVK